MQVPGDRKWRLKIALMSYIKSYRSTSIGSSETDEDRDSDNKLEGRG